MSHSDPGVRSADQSEEVGPWDPALAQLRAWDRDWAETCEKMTTNPWIGGVLPHKFIELVSVGLNAACTNLNPDGTRQAARNQPPPADIPRTLRSCGEALLGLAECS